MHTIALDLVPDFQGWVGLNSGLYMDCVRVTPSIGIHCVPMERLISRIDEGPYTISNSASFAYTLSDLRGGVAPFVFDSEESLASEAERLASVIAECGIPLMRDFANYEALVSVCKARSGILGGYPEKAAAALYLMGRSDEARKWLDMQREPFRLDDAPAWQPFETFAAKLRQIMDEEEIPFPISVSPSSYYDKRWDYLREADVRNHGWALERQAERMERYRSGINS
ncbi:hypothetical protein [Stenotrophomonas sp. SORGH_AS_0321]|uniref:hypothetical protein n=1 Tax=Stenotrophomonas sp. SORGH_AS_0321 TaxID=3041787 RepID=UPI00285F3FCC|nr:hypothetical protein [Stenotrophomonas sp. SORGH_AS_0321]MDR6095683.1 hypothetical protein [Stenotrophomonas sp. SORGH_AS_0321]